MADDEATSYSLPPYRVRARNTSATSDNKIHDDETAARYGFRGGLVPGVTVYAYMTAPLVAQFSDAWLERGSMQVKFHQPFYEGEEVIVRAEVDAESDPIKVAVRAERGDGTACATGLATIDDRSEWLGRPLIDDYPARPLPPLEARPQASRESVLKGRPLGTLTEKLDLADSTMLRRIDESLPVYFGEGAVAHPALLLGLANQVLMRNFDLGPWIHTASDLINWSAARHGEEISVRGRVADAFERKGHEFVRLDLLLVANATRVVQQVRHTAIYRISHRV
ncbi:MAG TPA: MaoC family dehydratase [Blastocatellia bacterium]|jgi:acyl dehydratase|nr:MaoC family dehydratase [Blastocatellia bacterium]